MISGTAHADDLRLARDCLQGRRRALDQFAARMRVVPRLLAVQNATRGRPLDALELEDLVQDTLTLIWTKLGDYAGQASLESWSYPFCSNVLANAVRKKRRRAPVVVFDHEQVVTGAAEPERRTFRFDDLHQALARLGTAADILRMKYFEGLTFQEIAGRLEVPTETAKARCYRALTTLRQRLGNGGAE